jgi:hypothetical protein
MMNQDTNPEENNDEGSLYSSSDDGTDTGAGTDTSASAPVNEAPKKQEEIQIAAAETTRIRALRPILVTATLAIGATVTTLVFLWLQKGMAEKGQTAVRNCKNP